MSNNKIDKDIIIKKERNSNLELLRIVSIILIIAHHYSVHGGWSDIDYLSINGFWIQFISLGGKLGVNCFVIITGYFMVNSKFHIKKLFKIALQVLFYSVSIMIIFKFLNIENIGIRETLESFLPLIYDKYWFATAYVELYILSPYLNKAINNCTHRQYIGILIILTFFLSIIPTLTNSLTQVDNLSWFVFLYLLAGYIRKYEHRFYKKARLLLGTFFLGGLIIVGSVLIFDIESLQISNFPIDPTCLREMNSLVLLICSCSIFLYFKNMKMKTSKIINNISATTFGIYLIHDNKLVRDFLWTNISKNNLFYNSKWLIAHSIITILGVFIVCMIIEYLRIRFIEKNLFWFFNKHNIYKFKSGSNNYINKYLLKYF